ncbi:MAG: 30S ribosomal protein S7 [Chloroflexi bacterium]|nr:30S ribosomal protein S7 [Chloroflexota bacterium]
MPRRGNVPKRKILPDPMYGSENISRLVHRIMIQGRKATAEQIVYDALSIVETKSKKSPVDVFDEALKNVTPVLEIKPRRVGGATYQVPVEVEGNRRMSLALRWLVNAARARSGHSMAEKLSAEILDAVQKQGAAIKKREETHKMAEANKAFAHFRW